MDADEFGRQLAATIPNCRQLAIRLAGNVPDAEDLLQATAERVLLKRHRYVDQGTMGGWINQTMYHVFLNQRRYEKARREYSNADEEVFVRQSIDQHYDVDLTARRAVAFIGTLIAPHAQVLTMEALGYDYVEMAAVAGVQLGTIKSRLSRARESMRAEFGGSP